MTIFASLLKSPETPPSRSVPNGGLGGLVQVLGEVKPPDADAARPVGGQHRHHRKKPPPIQVNNDDNVPVSALTAPTAKTSHGFLKSPVAAAMTQIRGMAMVVTSEGVTNVHNLSLKEPIIQQEVVELHEDVSPVSSEAEGADAMPVELPGSILLPGQGFPPENKSAATATAATATAAAEQKPQTQPRRARANTEQSLQRPRDIWSPLGSHPVDPNAPWSNGARNKKLLRLARTDDWTNGSTASTPTRVASPSMEQLKTKTLACLSAEDLLRVLPKLKGSAIVREWVPAMRKEFEKSKGLLARYSSETPLEDFTLITLCQDMRSLLDVAKQVASHYDQEFVNAQAETDAHHQSDLEKIDIVETELGSMLLQTSAEDKCAASTKEHQHEDFKGILHRVIDVVGGFIRNNVAYTLYEKHEPMTKEVVEMIRAFSTHMKGHHMLKADTIPAQQYQDMQRDLHETQASLITANDVAASQQQAVMEAHNELDKVMKQLAERDAQLASLFEHNRRLEKELSDGLSSTSAGALARELAGRDEVIANLQSRFEAMVDERARKQQQQERTARGSPSDHRSPITASAASPRMAVYEQQSATHSGRSLRSPNSARFSPSCQQQHHHHHQHRRSTVNDVSEMY